MTPIRVEDLGVEPVGLTEMRSHLRIAEDEDAEDELIAELVAAARANVEAATRRLLRPARFRLSLPAWPASGVLRVPLSPLVAVTRFDVLGADGTLEALEPTLLRIGPDPWDAPRLLIDAAAPPPARRAALIELVAGCGGDGPPVPAPLAQAIRMTVADWFEDRGDAGTSGPAASSRAVGDLVARHRLLRL